MKTEAYALGLIGYPLEHSFSPRMHNAALSALGLTGAYRLFPIPPLPGGAAALADLLERLRAGELDGLNVTIPHKQSVIPLLDALSPGAQATGAVNTIVCKEGQLEGHNTDITGFLADLERFIPQTGLLGGQNPPTALVLGAGGAARAVTYALATSGWVVIVSARRLEQAQAVCAALQPYLDAGGQIQASPLNADSLASIPINPKLIVQATPAGMYPDRQTSAWPAGATLPASAAIYDLVYNPPETSLMQVARQFGLQAENGLGMLLEQAILAFELWTGCTPPRDVMREALFEQSDKMK